MVYKGTFFFFFLLVKGMKLSGGDLLGLAPAAGFVFIYSKSAEFGFPF